MAIRIEVVDWRRIQITRYTDGKLTAGPYLYEAKDVDSAMNVAFFWLKQKLEQAERERFVSQADRDAARAYKQLLTERSRFNGGKKS